MREGDAGRRGEERSHLAVYVGWPLAGGLMMGMVLAACAGGLTWLARGDWMEAVRTAGRWFCIVWAATTVGVFVYALLGWAGPRRIERMRQEVVERPGEVKVEKEWVVRNPSWTARVAKTAPATEHAVWGLDPAVEPEIRELYEFVTRVWPGGNVSRAECSRVGFGRGAWERLVGGRRGHRGQESARGLLARAGLVYQDAGGHWQIAPEATLERALGMNRKLERYAEERARLVRLG